MKLLSVKEFYQSYEEMAEQTVVVSGWVRTKRVGKEVAFVEISDGTCMKTIQVVAEVEKQFDLSFGVGACLLVRGELKLTPEAKQVFEIVAEGISVMGDSAPDYPVFSHLPYAFRGDTCDYRFPVQRRFCTDSHAVFNVL